MTNIAQNVYNRRRAGISVAIALSIGVPFIIIAGCCLVRMREVVRGRSERSERNEFAERHEQMNSQPDKPDTNGGNVEKNSKHEGVYYTNEPLDYYTRN